MTPVAALPCAPQPGPTAGLNSWLLRKPRPAGFCLIVPDNPAALEIAAGASGAELLREHIQEFLCNRFGPENVGTHGAGFVIALAGLDLLGTVDRSVQEIAELRLEGRARSCAITASAGVLWLDDDMAVEQDEVLGKLSSAVLSGRLEGRRTVVLSHEEAQHDGATERAAKLVCDLPAAIVENRLLLNAQDIVPCRAAATDAREVEILIQMQDRDGTTHPPSEFLPAAENSELIEMVDRWVLRNVLVGHAAQLDANPNLRLSVNVSARTLGNPEFVAYLSAILRESGMSATRLQIEITETAQIGNFRQACENVAGARRLGCRIALDDFGAGLSGYRYLKMFEPDCLKIDGSLVTNITERGDFDFRIVSSIVALAHDVGMEVVAEHVSSPEILDVLRRLGVDKVQGYEVGRPRPLAEIFGATYST